MSFLKSNLAQRVMTAVLGITLLLVLLIQGGPLGAKIISVIFSAGLLYEYADLCLTGITRSRKTSFWVFGMVGAVLFSFASTFTEWWLLLGFLYLFTYYLFVASGPNALSTQLATQELFTAFFGWIYCALLPSYLARIGSYPQGWKWIVFLLALIWICDTAAYFSGRLFGKRPLNPVISAGKTWEGAIGGAVGTILVGALAPSIGFPDLPLRYSIGFSILIAIMAPCGDLAESVLKRAYGKKDSGNLLPGHGGFLDRFDSLLFGLPLLYVGLQLYTLSAWW